MIELKRVYDKPQKGYGILVDRLWPRGLSKDNINLWLKDIAPSENLRKWFSHDPKKWSEFKDRYKKELKDKITLITRIRDIEKKEKHVVLLYAAKDEQHNNARVLLDYLTK